MNCQFSFIDSIEKNVPDIKLTGTIKKFEIARDNHRKKSLEDLIRRDQRELDELALQAINFRERK